MSTLGSPARPAHLPVTQTWFDNRLVPLAAQLAGTVRDYGDDETDAILRRLPAEDTRQLILTLAAMVDHDRPLSALLDWTRSGPVTSTGDTATDRRLCDKCGGHFSAKHHARHRDRCTGPTPAPVHPPAVRLYPLSGNRWRVACGYPDCGQEMRSDYLTQHLARQHGAPEDRVDEMAVEEAVAGRRNVHLTPTERTRAVAELDEKGLTAEQIAARLGVTTRTVNRARARARRGDDQQVA